MPEQEQAPAPEPSVTTATDQSDDPSHALQDRIDDLLTRLTRAQADLANLKRRSNQRVEETARFAIAGFAADLLSAIDHLDRALASVPPELIGFSFLEGLVLTRQHFGMLLSSHSVEPIAAAGNRFDPTFHQAVDTDGSETPNYVVRQYQTGYKIGERVIRPALVRVGANPKTCEEDSGEPGCQAPIVAADADVERPEKAD